MDASPVQPPAVHLYARPCGSPRCTTCRHAPADGLMLKSSAIAQR
jgi:hypothetical protein